MSVSMLVQGNLAPAKQVALSGTTETDVLAPARGLMVITDISVANNTASNAEITLRLNDGTTSVICWHKDIPADDTVGASGGIPLPLVLNADATSGQGAAQKLTAQAETGGALVVTVIYTIQQPIRS